MVAAATDVVFVSETNWQLSIFSVCLSRARGPVNTGLRAINRKNQNKHLPAVDIVADGQAPRLPVHNAVPHLPIGLHTCLHVIFFDCVVAGAFFKCLCCI